VLVLLLHDYHYVGLLVLALMLMGGWKSAGTACRMLQGPVYQSSVQEAAPLNTAADQ
jgi:hypothetical protein